MPVLPALAQELRTHLQGRRQGYLFESNRHTLYSVRTVQAVVERFARQAGIAKRVYPHLLRHSIATILLDSGLVPIDQVQKFLGPFPERLNQGQGGARAQRATYLPGFGGRTRLH